jgi:hypothetical protein
MAEFWMSFGKRRRSSTSFLIWAAPKLAVPTSISSDWVRWPRSFRPAMLAALQRVGQEGGTLPERLDGKLAVRVAMGYDAMHTLHQQLGRAFPGLTAGTGAKKASETRS